MSRREAAERLGESPRRYQDAETDRLSERDARAILARAHEEGPPRPTVAELCALARRRSELRLYRVAGDLGVTHLTYLRRERGGDEDVVAYWRRTHGFIF